MSEEFISTPVVPDEAYKQEQLNDLAKVLHDTRWSLLNHWWEREDFATREVQSCVSVYWAMLAKLDTIEGGRALYEKALADNNVTAADLVEPPGFSSRSDPEWYNEVAERYGWEPLTKEQFADHWRRVEKGTERERKAFWAAMEKYKNASPYKG